MAYQSDTFFSIHSNTTCRWGESSCLPSQRETLSKETHSREAHSRKTFHKKAALLFVKKTLVLLAVVLLASTAENKPLFAHGTAVSPQSRAHKVYKSNPENPNFLLAKNAVTQDGKTSYYTWNQISQNIPEAVPGAAEAGPGFDYSPWVPDGHLASGGRFTGNVSGLLYEGLDQVSDQWPTTSIEAGENLSIDFLATAVHSPSVWDVWMTTSDWDPNTALNWNQMEFLGRPNAILDHPTSIFNFNIPIPQDRSGHHVIWIAWQRDDPVGEVFFSTSDVMVAPVPQLSGDYNGNGVVDAADFTLWRDTLGSTTNLAADGDGNGTIEIADFTFWKSHFGNSSASSSDLTEINAVPEPSSLLLLAFGMVGFFAMFLHPTKASSRG